jgi:hypothetical protein
MLLSQSRRGRLRLRDDDGPVPSDRTAVGRADPPNLVRDGSRPQRKPGPVVELWRNTRHRITTKQL